MDGVKEIILQTKNVEYIKRNLGKEQWIQVSGHKDMNGADAGLLNFQRKFLFNESSLFLGLKRRNILL